MCMYIALLYLHKTYLYVSMYLYMSTSRYTRSFYYLLCGTRTPVLNDERDRDRKGADGWLKYASIMRLSEQYSNEFGAIFSGGGGNKSGQGFHPL